MCGDILSKLNLDIPSYKMCFNPTCLSRVDIIKVIFNDPATIVIWSDGSKTVVKCQEGDTYNKELGLAMCIAKKYLGNKSNFNNIFKKYIEGYDPRGK